MDRNERKRFFGRLNKRLDVGEIEYGNKSIDKDKPVLLDEIQQELEDVCNWSAILWTKIERLRRRVAP